MHIWSRMSKLFAIVAAGAAALLMLAAPSQALIAPPIGTVGVAYSYTGLEGFLGACGINNPTSLPPGLSFDGTTKDITGTPTTAGTFAGIVLVCGGQTAAVFDITINPAVEAPMANATVAAITLALLGLGFVVVRQRRRVRARPTQL
jgi:hypothetical protein